jgi:hypothetical protein
MDEALKLALTRDLLIYSEKERDAVLKAKQTHIDDLRQRFEMLLGKTAATTPIVAIDATLELTK